MDFKHSNLDLELVKELLDCILIDNCNRVYTIRLNTAAPKGVMLVQHSIDETLNIHENVKDFDILFKGEYVAIIDTDHSTYYLKPLREISLRKYANV